MFRKSLGPVILLAVVCLSDMPLFAADWPTYRHDARRSGITAEGISTPLSEDWVFTPTHGPAHAWGDPQPKPVEKVLELPRMRFDDAFHVVAAGGTMYFGSSGDNQVYALDARTGAVRWAFTTDGPVRLAPTVWKGKVYVGSDDGCVYCLNARDGKLAWRFVAAPRPEKILGNGKMISVWPVRTGVVIDGGVAYFGAGVWPVEGLYLYAVDAATGALRWKNDTYGAGGMANISPQGHLAVSAERLFMPTGRTMPAGFDRKTGEFLFHPSMSWRQTGLFGGTHVQIAKGLVLTGVEQLVGMFEKNGRPAMTEWLPARTPSTGPRRLAVADDALYLLNGKELIAADPGWLTAHTEATQRALRTDSVARRRNALDRERKQLARQHEAAAKKAGGKRPAEPARLKELVRQIAALDAETRTLRAERKAWWDKRGPAVRWRAPFAGSDEVILAGKTVFAGGADTVAAFDAGGGKPLWSAKVHGRARSLAVAGGRLFVSTDKGSIHCFVPGDGGARRKVAPEIAAKPFADDAAGKALADKAERLVKDTGVRRGYALVLGEPTGRLAWELARRTDLTVYLVEADEKKADAARKALIRAGVYGEKVVVMHAPGRKMPFSDYFANLIVCGPGMFAGGRLAPGSSEVVRMVKPCGGVLAMVYPTGAGRDTVERWGAWGRSLIGKLAVDEKALHKLPPSGFVAFDRGPLKGAGTWMHQYGEPGNTCASNDERVKGALGVLWYGEPGPERMANRHASAASPLAFGGRMFIQGENVVMAYDAYNGVRLWQREIPGAMRLGLKDRPSNFAGDGKSVFVAVGDSCLRLDAATGETIRTYKAPRDKQGKQRHWEYVAVADGVLFGTRANECVFAVEVETGKPLWAHEGGSIEPRTICLGGGRMYYVDKAVTAAQREEALKGITPKQRLDRRGRPVKPDVRLVVAVNAKTGRREWARPQYVSDCVKISSAGGDLTVMYAHNVVLLCGQPWNGHFWREFMAGEFSRRSLIALAAYSGEPVWSGRKGYRSRPLIVGDRIIAEPWSYDIQTGRAITRKSPLTGVQSAWQMARPGHHCGNIVGAPHALFFRSGVLAYYDMDADHGTAHFSGHRPGCWVNCLPANGLLIIPEASSGCICPFALHTTIVFQPQQRRRTWGMYSTGEALAGARKVAINFGAPGDRKAADGTLWLAWPRPRSYEQDYNQRLVMNFRIDVSCGDAGKPSYRRLNSDFFALDGTKDPWLYAFGCDGLTKCSIPLQADGAKPARYTVRLHFAEMPRGDGAAFDVALQGKVVRKAMKIAPAAAGAGKAVIEEFRNVRIGGDLQIELRSGKGMPLLCAVEAVREGR